jgi:hypothetical protein
VSDVRFLKLVTGDELIARVTVGPDQELVLEDPMRVVEFLGMDGSRASYLSRWLPHSTGNVTIAPSSLVTPALPVHVTVEEHWRASVDYSKEVTDEDFIEGIKHATVSLVVPKQTSPLRQQEPGVETVNSPKMQETVTDEFRQRVFLSQLARLTTTKN